MIPSVLAEQLEQGIKDFLRTTFPSSTPLFHGLIDKFLETEGNLFKGPYLSLFLPFRKGDSGKDFFSDVTLKFQPFLHQELAFKRLSGEMPKSTIIATGTGSGKTESFLYPILNHCYQKREQKGIKAILIYPMNALATDQAKRLASIIYKNPKLKGNVTAGLFVGQSEKSPQEIMSEDYIITNKEIIRSNPPDILLTNYKMLDYLLIRPKDSKLWIHNTLEVLKYLVVDELHTFDGAQGTDLSCLLRRLKSRLEIPEKYLCCIGTSATIGGEDGINEIRKYGEEVFSEDFDENSIITENRLSVGEFLESNFIKYLDVVSQDNEEDLKHENFSSYEEYIAKQYQLWFREEIDLEHIKDSNWQLTLGEKLKEHLFFQNLLRALQDKNRKTTKVKSYQELISELKKITRLPANTPENFYILLINSICSLISVARVNTENSDSTDILPFLNVRFQLWTRELRRMVASVEEHPELKFSDDLKEEMPVKHLPVIHCRDCGSTGWGGLRNDGAKINNELREFYIGFFNKSRFLTFLFPIHDELTNNFNLQGEITTFCGKCLHISQTKDKCQVCENTNIHRVFIPDSIIMKNNKKFSKTDCPFCRNKNSLTIMGARAASLTSVLIGQLFSSGYNDDKKLVTFSDSVQDAAHRAGFFGARTYQSNFRSALQQLIQNLDKKTSLDEVSNLFYLYWSDKFKDERYYVSNFIAPNMEWLSDFNILKEKNIIEPGSNLKELVNNRISWEIISEFGFRARIGRTLEKTASAVAFTDQDILNNSTEIILDKLSNKIGIFRELNFNELQKFLLSIIMHLKLQGAIYHFSLESFIESGGNTYLLNRIPYMQSFSANSRLPKFLSNSKLKSNNFEKILSDGRSTWYESRLRKSFSHLPLILSFTEDIYKIILAELSAQKILFQREVKGQLVWGILPNVLKVSNEVNHLACNICEGNIAVEKSEVEMWTDIICLRFECNGKYQPIEIKDNYYNKLYASADIQRIVAEEHTGLLERDKREKVEKDFINRKYPWQPNLLSATPTIEMGIDIGDLSSVILCSVPPTQANYMQRIGRAGRKDGNSLNLTVANGKPHDLYFYTTPKEMLEGKTSSPGVFLNASAILERQFTAFCFDQWVKSGIGEYEIPRLIKDVLRNVKAQKANAFPYNFLDFIVKNQNIFIDTFLNLFKNNLTDDSIKQLNDFVNGSLSTEGSLGYKILDGMIKLMEEKESYITKRNSINSKIKSKKETTAVDQNFKDEMDELYMEKAGLTGLIVKIDEKQTLNFFTDEGLLPNYAFPEAGVVLKSIIFRKKINSKQDKEYTNESSYDHWTYEYERSASSAINELAPENSFYAGGRCVEIDQIGINSPEEIETWRFCNICSYTEQVLQEKTKCPRCNSNLWSDSAQKRNMIRLRQVFATTSDKESRIGDDSDDRQPVFYTTQMLVDIHEENVKEAYKIKDDKFPFGFEFINKATFRDINFGKKDENGEKISIAGIKMPRNGFLICKYCGKLQKENEEKPSHAISCKARNKEKETNFVECLYLYRDFISEAIKILLPITTTESEKKLSSLVAALQLGLKKKFSGAVEHLRVTTYQEPTTLNSDKKQYLVLYDTVPGGTGYLKQLMRSTDPLMEVLEIALNELKICECNKDPEKDGCYHCLYAYRNSSEMSVTSRTIAVNLISDIIKYKNDLEKTDSLKKISINSLIDSELEARFIQHLRNYNKDGVKTELRPSLVNNKPGYFLKVNDKSYYVELQVPMRTSDGVSVFSRADFVLRSTKESQNVKPIVIFTDGFAFHHNRIDDDTAQRMALLQSGKYNIWSLTWEDIISSENTNYYNDFLSSGVSEDKLNNYTKYVNAFKANDIAYKSNKSNFDLLIQYLANPDKELWESFAALRCFLWLNLSKSSETEFINSFKEKLSTYSSVEINDIYQKLEHNKVLGLVENVISDKTALTIFTTITKEDLTKKNYKKFFFHTCLDDKFLIENQEAFKKIWIGFLKLYNIMQFLPLSSFTTTSGLIKLKYSSIRFLEAEKYLDENNLSEQTFPDEWEEIMSYLEPDFQKVFKTFFFIGLSLPELMYSLVVESDLGITGEALLAFPDKKLAFFDNSQLNNKEAFKNNNWKVFSLEDLKNIDDPEKIKEALEI